MPGRSLVFALLTLLFAAQAAAQSEVVVLGIRSVEGDDDVAHDLTTALREAAEEIGAWKVSPTAVSMAQMALAHGCEEVDVACLVDIAKGLQADLVVYGTLRRNSAREDYDFAFNLNLFDARTGSIQNGVDDTIVRRETTKGALGPRAKRLIAKLAGEEVPTDAATDPSLGTIVVHANVEAADVLINDQPVGTLEGGTLQYDGLQEGMYRVELRAYGYAPFVKTLRVQAGQRAEVEANLQVGVSDHDPSLDWESHADTAEGGHGLRWLGWTLVGVGAVATVGMVVSWAEIIRINNDDRLERYSGDVAAWNQQELAKARADDRQPILYDDYCVAANDEGLAFSFYQQPEKFKEVQSLCDQADTWEVLQYVFLGTAVAAGGTGVVLLLTSGGSTDEAADVATPRFALTPQVGKDRAGLQATLRF